MRNRKQPLLVVTTEIDQPAIIRTGIGGREFWVLYPPFPEDADGWIEKGDVDAFFVHHFEARLGLVTPERAAIDIGFLAWSKEFLGIHTNAAECTQGAPHDFSGFIIK